MNRQTGPLDQALFVGREDAIQVFCQTLDDPQRKPVLFFCGEGGIGKTWLLRRLRREVQEGDGLLVAPSTIDLIETRYHRISGVRQEIVEFLGHAHFDRFREAQAIFEMERDKPEEERVAESAIKGLQARADEQFMADCRRALKDRTAILFFDTFERVSWEQVGYWILHELPQAVPEFLIVAAGRPEPTEEACPPENVSIHRITLAGLPAKDASTFFASRATGSAQESSLLFSPDLPLPVPPTHEVLAALYDKLDGHPLKLDLAILWLKTGIQTIDQVNTFLEEGTLNEELLKPLRQLGRIPGIIPTDVPKPERTELEVAAFEVILLVAYLNRRFNQRFLERVYALPRPTLAQAKRVISWLPQMYFVKERPGGDLQLHDEMERLVLDYLWQDRDPSGDFRRELAQGAIRLYEDLIAKSVDEREKEELNAERLGYLLRIDVQQGYKEFIDAFDRNLEGRDFGLCELLLTEIVSYEDHLVWHQRVQLNDRRFQLALGRQDFDLAGELAKRPNQKVQYLLELHEATWKTRVEQARQHLLEAAQLCAEQTVPLERQALVQRALGFTHRTLGQWDEAIKWYRQCQETAKQMGKKGAWLYADTQNSEGYVYGLRGEYRKAETLIQEALDLRERLNRRVEVGQSFSTWGEVNRFAGDYRSANRHYDEALAIFEELRDPEWQAIVLQQRGENTRRIAVKMRRQGDKEGAEKWLSFSFDNLEKSRALYERYNLQRGRSMLLRRLGRSLRDAGRFQEAQTNLEKSYQMALDNQDRQEQMECMNSLAWLALRQKDFDGVMRYTEPLLEIKAGTANELVFRGRAHVLRGRGYAIRREWTQSLDEFVSGLTLLGQSPGYGHERLHDRIGDLRLVLDDLPDVTTKQAWCDHLIAVWRQKGLDNTVPELVEMCRRYKESLQFMSEVNDG